MNRSDIWKCLTISLILPAEAIDDWIDLSGEPEKIIEKALTEMMVETAI